MDFQALVGLEFYYRLRIFSMHHICDANTNFHRISRWFSIAYFPYYDFPEMHTEQSFLVTSLSLCLSSSAVFITVNKRMFGNKLKAKIGSVGSFDLHLILWFQDRLFAQYVCYGNWLRSSYFLMYVVFVSYELFEFDSIHELLMNGSNHVLKSILIHHQ